MTVPAGDADRAHVPGSHILPHCELRFSKATYSTSQSWSEGEGVGRKGFSAGESEGHWQEGHIWRATLDPRSPSGPQQSWA